MVLIPDPLGWHTRNKLYNVLMDQGSVLCLRLAAWLISGYTALRAWRKQPQLFVALVSHKTSGDSAEQQATSYKLQAW